EVLGAEEVKVGRISIQEVQARLSRATVVGGRPAEGNVCRPASGEASFGPPPPPPPPRDGQPPRIRILAPREGATLSGNPVNVVCEVTDDTGVAQVTVAGAPATQDAQGRWVGRVRARDGANRVSVQACDAAGNEAQAQVTFTF